FIRYSMTLSVPHATSEAHTGGTGIVTVVMDATGTMDTDVTETTDMGVTGTAATDATGIEDMIADVVGIIGDQLI
ncbi:hypothetical protein AAVH_35094, partial [Aphelenchoides avenae]